MVATIRSAANDEFEAEVIAGGVEDDVPDDVRTAVEDAEAGILDDSVTVPTTMEALIW